MKRQMTGTLLTGLMAAVAVAGPEPKNTVKYRAENSDYTVYSCEIQLAADGYWEISDKPGRDTVQLYLTPPQIEHGALLPQGRRMRQVQLERNINQGMSHVSSLAWRSQEFARTRGGVGPKSLTDFDAKKHKWFLRSLERSPWQHDSRVKVKGPYVFLLPQVKFIFEGRRVLRKNRRVVAVELTPFVDDGKHWVSYTDGGCERVAIDRNLVKKYNLQIRPVMPVPSPEQPGRKEWTYTIVAVQERDTQTRIDVPLRNTLTDTVLKIKWPLSKARSDKTKIETALKDARANAWRPYIYRSGASTLQLWAASELGDRARDVGMLDDDDESTTSLGVLGGRAAVRETLQMHALGRARRGQEQLTIPVDTVKGVEVKSHPYEKMLGGKKGGSLPLANIVPHDRFLVYAAKPSALFPFLDDGAEFLSGAGSVLIGNSIKYDLKAKYLERFGMGEKWLRTFLNSGAVKEMALVFPDMFFIDGTEVSAVSRLGKPGLIGQMLKLIGVWGLDDDNIVEKESKTGGTVYWAMRKDLLFVSTSNVEIKALLALWKDDARSLGKSAEFRYMLTQLPVTDDTRIYAYFSDAFIRRLVGPRVKIAQHRRLAARSDMERITSAALLARLNGIKPPLTLEALVEHRYLPERYLKSDYSMDDDLVVTSERYGTLARMATFAETPVTMISGSEDRLYRRYVTNYTRFWSRFFDPIAMRLDDVPDKSLELTTFILPLLDNSIYDAFREALHAKEDNQPLNNPVIEPRPVVKLSLNLKEEAWTEITEGFHEMFEDYASVNPAILDDLGPGFHLAVHDADPVIAIGSGDLLGGLGGSDFMDDTDMLLFPIVLSVLTRPCTLVVETQDPVKTKRYLRQAAAASLLMEKRDHGWFGVDLHQVAGRDEWVFTMDIEGIIRMRYGVQVEGSYVMIRNIPWSSADKIVKVEKSKLNAARLEAYPGSCKLQLAGLHASAADRYRVAAGNSMGYIYPLLASKTADLDNIEATYKKLFGFRPVHPGGGRWQWDGVNVSSTAYGTVLKQTTPAYDAKAPVFGLLGKIDSLNVSMQFEKTGLRTKVRWKTKQP